jgi:hypothetical protein
VKQLFATSVFGLILLASLLLFAKIEPPEKPVAPVAPVVTSFNFSNYLQQAKQKLSANQLVYVSNLESNTTRGDVKNQLIKSFTQIASFWKDSARLFVPFS